VTSVKLKLAAIATRFLVLGLALKFGFNTDFFDGA
jgi:hypothetical protein